MHPLSSPVYNAKTQIHVVAQAIIPSRCQNPETPSVRHHVTQLCSYLPNQSECLSHVLQRTYKPETSSRRIHARSSDIGHLIMQASCSYRCPMMLQRHITHVPHQTSHLRSLRRLRYHTEILALA